MCGICGIKRFAGNVTRDEIELFSKFIEHRGPDGNGCWINSVSDTGLGHRRLTILDKSENGHQPMISPDGRFIICYNGEVFNFLEIRQELEKEGFEFHTESDTEVILVAYEAWGKKMLDRFNGMWAFAIYDITDESLLLCRDRFGIKPLYYYSDKEIFLFASEISALKTFIQKDLELNDAVLMDVLQGKCTFHADGQTWFKEIKSVQPGSFVELKGDKIVSQRWYKMKKVSVPKTFRKQAVVLRELIENACSLRLRSDVEIGTCLSGGLDSGSVAAVLSKRIIPESPRFSNFHYQSFCASFQGTPIDEAKEAAELSDRLNLDFKEISVSSPSEEELELAMSCCDGPYSVLSFYPIWKLYQQIRKSQVIVSIDGQGPDELLGGYNYINEALPAAFENKNPLWFFDVYNTYRALGESEWISSEKIAREAMKTFLSEKQYILGEAVKTPIKQLLHFLGMRKYVPLEWPDEEPKPMRSYPDWIKNSFDRHLFDVFNFTTLPALLFQYDRCSMAHGVECRMPFLDYRIVEFIFSLPVKSKLGGGYTKRILRAAMKGILPDSTRLNKRKLGFTAPMVDWIKFDLKEWMLKQMSTTTFLNNRYFDGKKIRTDYEIYISSSDEAWESPWRFWPPVHLSWWLDHVNSTLERSNISDAKAV